MTMGWYKSMGVFQCTAPTPESSGGNLVNILLQCSPLATPGCSGIDKERRGREVWHYRGFMLQWDLILAEAPAEATSNEPGVRCLQENSEWNLRIAHAHAVRASEGLSGLIYIRRPRLTPHAVMVMAQDTGPPIRWSASDSSWSSRMLTAWNAASMNS